jgi:hypothetical protein
MSDDSPPNLTELVFDIYFNISIGFQYGVTETFLSVLEFVVYQILTVWVQGYWDISVGTGVCCWPDTDRLSTGLLRHFCSYWSLLLTRQTEGEGSRHRGSSVANSNWLSSANWSSCVQRWPSLIMLYMSESRDWNKTSVIGTPSLITESHVVHVGQKELK